MPIERDWEWLDDLAGPVDEDFAWAVAERPAPQERAELGTLG